MADGEEVKLLADKDGSFETKVLKRLGLSSPGEEVFGDLEWLSVTVNALVGEGMPNDDQQLPGDGDNGFFAPDADGKTVKLLLPV